MLSAPKTRRKSPVLHRGAMPQRMRVLYVTTAHRTGGWLAEAFAADSAAEVDLEESLGLADGVSRLREELYDAVLVSHDPDQLDALELLEALRAGGSPEPIVVLGAQSEQEMAALVFEAGGDAYVCVNTTTTRTLLWTVARAIERHQLIKENRRLTGNEEQRLQKEKDEAQRLLERQRGLLAEREDGAAASEEIPDELGDPPAADQEAPPNAYPLPPKLVSLYRDLLRTYVIMGAGNLSTEMNTLANLFASAGLSARRTLELHLEVLEELVRGLGSRSTRHVMARADLLVLEVMMYLAEGYRQRYDRRVDPPQQRMLPGFEVSPPGLEPAVTA